MLQSQLEFYLPKVLHAIICDYAYWFVKEGSLIDVQGASESFNIFRPSGHRWDVCVIKKITNNDNSLIIKPIHRFAEYPFLYRVNKNIETEYSIGSPSIRPFLSKVDRSEVCDLKDTDLVDIEDMKDGKWKVAEVTARTPLSVWIQYGDVYQSQAHKETLREWIDLPDDRLARYLTHSFHFK